MKYEVAEIYRKAMGLVIDERRIDAVRVLRDEGGLSLTEAKELMEAMVEMRWTYPKKG